MNKIDIETKEIRKLLTPKMGKIEVKYYFSYYSLFKNEMMFSLFKEGRFYIRASKNHEEEMKHSPYTRLLVDESLRIHDCHFYQISNQIINQPEQYMVWIWGVLDELQKEKELLAQRKIRNLPNMNINLERLLQRNGINTIADLSKLGEVETFVALIGKGEDINDLLLFKLYGALHNQLVYTLDAKQKRHLLQEADLALYKAGLRKRFNSKRP